MNSPKSNTLPEFDKLWDFSDPAGTEVKFRELLQKTKQSGDHEYLLQLQTQIARTQGLQRKFDDAQKTLDTVKASMKSPLTQIRFNLEQGRVLNSNKKPQKAEAFFIKAYELSLEHHLINLAVDAAHMMAIAKPDVKDQILWNLKAIKLIENTQDEKTKKWLGSLYNNTAWSYHDTKDYDIALDFFKKAHKWHQQYGNDATRRIAKWSIGRCYRSMNEIEKSLGIQIELEKDCKRDGVDIDGYHAEEFGELYLLKGDKEKSAQYFKIAYDLLSKDDWFVSYEKDRLERIKRMGKL